MYSLARFLLPVLISASFALGFLVSAQAQTHVFVKNETPHPLRIHKTNVGGAKVSSKAWTQGVERVSPDEREIVVTLNRKGKVNWMDPTPRFVEPGKEVVFSTPVTLDDEPGSPIVLLQKLLGTGKTTKMWYSVGIEGVESQWYIDESMHRASWLTSKTQRWAINFRSYTEDGETHVEYVIVESQ